MTKTTNALPFLKTVTNGISTGSRPGSRTYSVRTAVQPSAGGGGDSRLLLRFCGEVLLLLLLVLLAKTARVAQGAQCWKSCRARKSQW